MALTLASAARLLSEYGLLREIIQGDDWTLDAQAVNGFDKPFGSITYDTRQVVSNTLLCCKGRFKAEYLDGIDDRGLAAYVAENDFSAATKAPGLIVNDARKAMSLLSAAFYGYPQDQLKVVGITGTKGKTTTAYLTQAMLNGCSGGKCALFSSVDNCLDGHTYAESDLTTPESMDAFRMMREAADNGMEYLVMEVSSQAYKVDRVFGLTFDVAAFLNISRTISAHRASDIRGLLPLQTSDRKELSFLGSRHGMRTRRSYSSGCCNRRYSRHRVRSWRSIGRGCDRMAGIRRP